MKGRVVVVGSVNVDLVIAGGRLPTPGETVLGGTFRRFHGGKGGNQAVAAARLAAPVVMVGAVGDDAFGEEALDALRAERVDVSTVAQVRGVATGVALILVGGGGENLISVAPGANSAVTPAIVREALAALQPGPDDVVLVGHEIPTAAVREALVAARDAGARRVLNPAPADGLDAAILGSAEVITPNRGELARLLDAAGGGVDPRDAASDPVAAARTLRGLVAPPGSSTAVLVSLGGVGAVLVDDRDEVVLAAPAVDAVDATGAGDTLNGALAAGLAAGLPLEEAARRGVIAASLSVAHAGARVGMPHARTLEAALRA